MWKPSVIFFFELNPQHYIVAQTKEAMQPYLQDNANGGKKVAFTVTDHYYSRRKKVNPRPGSGWTTTTLDPDVKSEKEHSIVRVMLVEEAYYGTLQNVIVPDA